MTSQIIKNWVYSLLFAGVLLVGSSFFGEMEVLAAIQIPEGAMQYNGNSYYVYDDASSWDDAKEKCERRGGHLATFTTAAENKVVYQYMVSKGYGSAFFGLYETETGKWKWVTGEKVSYTNWHEGEPNSIYEHYGCFYDVFGDETWNDGTENGTTYICEWEGYKIRFNENALKMKPGSSKYLKYSITNINDQAINKKVRWKSDNLKVAKVSSKGKVVAVNAGVCKITCKAGISNKSIRVVVIPKKVTGVSVVKTNSGNLQLKWKKQTGVKGYAIYMFDSDLSEFTKIRTVGKNTSAAVIRNLKKEKNTVLKFVHM